MEMNHDVSIRTVNGLIPETGVKLKPGDWVTGLSRGWYGAKNRQGPILSSYETEWSGAFEAIRDNEEGKAYVYFSCGRMGDTPQRTFGFPLEHMLRLR